MKTFLKKVQVAFQQLGRSLLLPIVAMPLAGITWRLGAEDMLNLPVLNAAGLTVFTNIDMLFAIGIAIGFTKTKDRAISALCSFLGLTTFKLALGAINPDVDMGVFAGIIAGVAAAIVYNRFHTQKLPSALSFFAMEKFPVTIITFVMLLLAIPFAYIWVPIQNALAAFTQALVSMGALGVGIYQFLNPLLRPFGLHHVLNSFIYWEMGSFTNAAGDIITGEIPRFLAGDPTAGLFLSGYYVSIGIGLPAATLAIARAAQKRKKEVRGMMISAAATAFVPGISEPAEFSFLFVSPLLYLLNCVYSGLAGAVCYLLNIHIGLTFGTGIIDYLFAFNIATNPLLILPVGAVFFALYYFSFYFIITRRNIPTMGRETDTAYTEEVDASEETLTLASKNYELIAKQIVNAFGGAGNIAHVDACMTRLRVDFTDEAQVDETLLKKMGFAGLVKSSSTHYQVIIGPDVAYIKPQVESRIDGGA